jgi:hypothetical protein
VARSKAFNQRRHARRRAFERYALNLHQDAQEQIIRKIEGGEARFICCQSQRISIWEVNYGGKSLPVVYDQKRKTLVTVLPEEALQKADQ